MKKKTITITAPEAIIDQTGWILVPVSTQKTISESFYLETIKERITFCLS